MIELSGWGILILVWVFGYACGAIDMAKRSHGFGPPRPIPRPKPRCNKVISKQETR